MKKILLSLFVVATFFSCKMNEKQQTVKIENKYSLTIPAFLTRSKGLNENASLQYQNGRKEFYVIVIDETKSEVARILEENDLTEKFPPTIKGYSDLLLQGFESNISIFKKSDFKDTLINNLPARIININGKADAVSAYYSIAYVEGKDRYYQVMVWTLQKFEDEYKDKMTQVLYTLKEL